ncbi:MAG TPA: hypothetical protein VGO34_03520 [Alphaproteobacteria bacterium]|jgi:hypothetical protein
MIRPIALFALAAAAVLSIAAAPAQAEGYCKDGHNFDEEKGLCYDPAAAYKPDVPKGESSSGSSSWLPSLSGLGGKAVLCNYGDRLVGSGDQAYCVSKATNKPYPAGR